MKTVRVYRLHPSPALAARLKAAQMEAAAVWNTCCTLHKNARLQQSLWPGQHEMQQAVSKEQGRVVLPMGKGRKLLVLPLALPEEAGACTLVWHRGFELHICVEVPQAEAPAGTGQATVDLGEIHLAAVTTTSGQALIVTGRGIRSRQPTAQQAGGPACQKAIPLHEVLASLEETATGQADGLPQI